MWLESLQRLFLVTQLAPLSFVYDDDLSAKLLPHWQRTVETVVDQTGAASGWTQHVVRWDDPKTGLRATAEVKAFEDFPAVEWLLRFENRGDADTPILEDVQALDLTLDAGDLSGGPIVLHTLVGSKPSQRDFMPMEREVKPGEPIELAPIGGRSSANGFPFYYLDCGNDRGLFVAIGWTGQWAASIVRDADGSLRLRAGMQTTHLRLHPGETIRTPRILLMRWEGQGDRDDAFNQFRRLMLSHYLPKIDGHTALPAIAAQSFIHVFDGGSKAWNTEQGQLAAAKINQELGCDTLWLDAAWFEGGFPRGVGNWTPRTDFYPHGLAPIGKECDARGLKFLLWYEPERVTPGSIVAREHPEFVLGLKDGRDGLLNLGDEQARQWITDLILQQMDEFGVDHYRNDFNYIDPLTYWRENDAPDRQGISEIRHIEGLYAMWDAIRARHPDAVPDNCASGGRRIDLEMCMRSLVQTRSDSVGKRGREDWDQCQNYGLSQFLPVHGTVGWELDAYGTRSSATAGFMAEWDILAADFPLERARAAIDEIKKNRPYWTGDYYPLTPFSLKPDVWMAYQYHREDMDAGMVLAFRRPDAAEATLPVRLRGLKADTEYRVTFIDDEHRETTRTMSGSELLKSLELRLDKPRTSLLIRYAAIPN